MDDRGVNYVEVDTSVDRLIQRFQSCSFAPGSPDKRHPLAKCLDLLHDRSLATPKSLRYLDYLQKLAILFDERVDDRQRWTQGMARIAGKWEPAILP